MKDERLSLNFRYQEFMCRCGNCDGHIPDEYLFFLYKIVVVLQTIRYQLDDAIIVSSGYRCPLHPLSKKRPSSYHRIAAAADVHPKKASLGLLIQAAEKHLFAGGIGYYPEEQYIHIDVREKPARWVRWKGEYIDLINPPASQYSKLFGTEQFDI